MIFYIVAISFYQHTNLLQSSPSTSTVIQGCSKRTRWDQPLTLVAVLYTKLGLPLPDELKK
jgi:hypothetical protein